MGTKNRQLRNLGPLPLQETIPSDQPHKVQIENLHLRQGWAQFLHPSERLSRHHTLSSARQRQDWSFPTQDKLDLALSARYHHEKDLFVSKGYFYTQPETLGETTWRVLRNELPNLYERQLIFHHPLQIRDHEQRNLAHEVKLDPSSDHLVLTRPNYHRRKDGAFFKV
ncbi:uncharacterized protein LOC132192641 [Neocloeon triangulifer]|uniref:uncharacterized protein LOC132192641 n=1 Tax=Neocloeon triangulifer TaxID=2078957 RepID=UPI00286FAA19|nr:uncharacterized protein LOC132192641 [Neocloeon triangulifer]XP_059468677.1 uncharacterized protein LOC132192641 [Neocloeon triangulifer]XP_059468678.1 uncharacterized protein LOC132192641 [Neocloeon triangulifer]